MCHLTSAFQVVHVTNSDDTLPVVPSNSAIYRIALNFRGAQFSRFSRI